MKIETISNDLLEISNNLKLQIEAKRKATKNETLLKNSIITIYFDELAKYIKEEQLQKNGLPLSQKAKIGDFKISILNQISDNDKLTNNVFSIFNQATLKKNGLKIDKLRLLDFSTITKYSKLSNSYISKIDYSQNIKQIVENINLQFKEFSLNEKVNNCKKVLEKNSYTVEKA